MSGFQRTAMYSTSDKSCERDESTLLFDEINKLKLEYSLMQGSITAEDERSIPASVVHSARTGTKEVLHKMIRARANRRKFLPADLFADPAWDMLLDLYLADILSKRVSVTSLCVASNVPGTTALRWIGTLDNEGLIERSSDPHDARRYFISLSEAGLARMDGYFENLARHGTRRTH